jgi:hypothetical protein
VDQDSVKECNNFFFCEKKNAITKELSLLFWDALLLAATDCFFSFDIWMLLSLLAHEQYICFHSGTEKTVYMVSFRNEISPV